MEITVTPEVYVSTKVRQALKGCKSEKTRRAARPKKLPSLFITIGISATLIIQGQPMATNSSRFVPGKSGNPHGRPKGAKSLKSLLKVMAKLGEKNRHPVDELIRLADKAESHPLDGGVELAADIWRDLLKYIEPQKKAIESTPEKPSSPAESLENAEKLLQEMEEIGNGNSTTDTRTVDSNTIGLDNGTVEVSPETSTEGDLRDNKGL